MPTQIVFTTGLHNTDFVTNTSRYATSPIIYWGDKKVITFTTYKRQPLTFSNQDKYLVIGAGEEYRPDLIAQRAFGSSLFVLWWKIMEANNIFDVFDLKAGLTLRIPAVA
jgi:hypothetical protein